MRKIQHTGIQTQIILMEGWKVHRSATTIPQETKRKKPCALWAVVVAQLVEQSLPTPVIPGSNPNTGKIIPTNCINWKDKNKEKEAGNDPSQKSPAPWGCNQRIFLVLGLCSSTWLQQLHKPDSSCCRSRMPESWRLRRRFVDRRLLSSTRPVRSVRIRPISGTD